MTLQLKTHTQAREEHISSARWYELQQVGLGEQYMKAVGECMEQIFMNPEHFGFLKGNYRHVKVEGFPICRCI